jgi:hypothetical protein
MTDQCMLAGPSASWASLAVPLNEIVSPDAQVVCGVGVTIVAVGGVLPGSTTKLAMLVADAWSVTSSLTVTFVLAEYVRDAVTPVASSNWPSPSRSHWNVSPENGPSSVVADASNWTVSGTPP